MNTCETCRFWKQVDIGYGECRRRCPLPLSSHDQTRERFADWPFTRPDEWAPPPVQQSPPTEKKES